MDLTSPTYERIMLEKLQLYAKEHTSSYVLRNADMHSYTDMVTDSLVHMLTSHVLAHEVGQASASKTIEVDEWESYWQHTKAVHFPTLSRWMKRPPRKRRNITVVVDIRSLNTFPDATIQYPKELGRPEMIVRKQIITARQQW